MLFSSYTAADKTRGGETQGEVRGNSDQRIRCPRCQFAWKPSPQTNGSQFGHFFKPSSIDRNRSRPFLTPPLTEQIGDGGASSANRGRKRKLPPLAEPSTNPKQSKVHRFGLRPRSRDRSTSASEGNHRSLEDIGNLPVPSPLRAFTHYKWGQAEETGVLLGVPQGLIAPIGQDDSLVHQATRHLEWTMNLEDNPLQEFLVQSSRVIGRAGFLYPKKPRSRAMEEEWDDWSTSKRKYWRNRMICIPHELEELLIRADIFPSVTEVADALHGSLLSLAWIFSQVPVKGMALKTGLPSLDCVLRWQLERWPLVEPLPNEMAAAPLLVDKKKDRTILEIVGGH